AGVLEPGHVHHPHAGVLGQCLGDRLGVQDGGLHERDAVGDEARVPAGQVVHDHHFDPGRAECADHVRADVAGPAGHHPGHDCAPSSKFRAGIVADSPSCTCAATRLTVAQPAASRPASESGSKVTFSLANGSNSRRRTCTWRSSLTAVNRAGWAVRSPFSSASGMSGTFTFSTRWSCWWLVSQANARSSTAAAVSQCCGAALVIELAIAGMSCAAAEIAAPTVAECMIAGPTFGPRLIPDSSMSGRGPRSPAPAA